MIAAARSLGIAALAACARPVAYARPIAYARPVAWLIAVVAMVALPMIACGETDIVARRVLAGCGGAPCAPSDAGVDASGDASDDVGPGGTCAAATCPNPITCTAPIPRAIVGDGCGAQPWAAPGFRHALCSCGDFVSQFPLTVERAGDAGAAPIAIDGDLTAGARLDIAGDVFVAGMLALVDEGSLDAGAVQAGTGRARCDCSARVALAPDAVRALVPGNPAGFDAVRFGDVRSDETIALGCGAYRVPRIAGPSGLHLAIDGHVVLVVEGDVELDGNFEARLADGALLELFVLGNVRVAGALSLGAEDDRVRLYVLGSGTIDLNAEAFVAGPIYAPHAELVTRGDLTTTGSIFARRIAPGGAVRIRYDSASARATTCEPP